MAKRVIRYLSVLLILILSVLIVFKPEVCRDSAFSGLVICGRIIIPSLFAFTMCVLFITRSGALWGLKFLNPVTRAVFGLNFNEAGLMLLSFLGGYPVGAKLLNNAVKRGEISSKRAGEMLGFCVNAGPAFIVTAVGSGMLNSVRLGYVLLLCHISGGVFLCLLSRFRLNKEPSKDSFLVTSALNAADNFVLSAAEASTSVMGICSFVILFSVINGYVKYFALYFPKLKIITLGLEVTNAVTLTDNLYLISFLLGFSGVCVWCQILSVSDKIEINYAKFIICRILHGAFSTVFLHIILKAFKITVETGAVSKNFKVEYIYSTPTLSISMLLMCIVFAISVASEKYAGKMLEDMV